MIETPVREYMQADPLTVTADTTVGDLADLFVARGVGYAPVVDADGRLLGVVSETDLILQEVEGEDLEQPHAIPFIGDPIVWGGTHDFEKQFRRSFGATAADLMTPKPVTIGPDETVHKAARILAREDVARLPVVEGDRVIGTIGRSDVVRALAATEF